MGKGGLGLVGGALLVVFGVGGLRQIFGVWVRPLEADFGVDRAAVAAVAALGLLLFGLFQTVLGRLVDVHGPRLVVPGAVLFAGLGSIASSMADSLVLFALLFVFVTSVGYAGAANATIAAAVVQRFEARRGLLLGVCSAGAPLGQLVLAPVAAWGIADFGWRTTLAGFGAALLLLILPIAWLLLGRLPAPTRTASTAPSLLATYRLALGSVGFQLLFWSYFICGMTTLGLVHTHIVPYGVDVGLPELHAAHVLGLLGLVNVVGLVGAGQAADRWGGPRPLIAAFAVRTLALLWASTATDGAALVLFVLVFGLTDMATIPLSIATATELFGPRAIGAVTGLLVIAHQLGSALGSYLGGLGYGLFDGYPPVMVAAAGLAFGAALLCTALAARGEGRGARDEPTLAPSGS